MKKILRLIRNKLQYIRRYKDLKIIKSYLLKNNLSIFSMNCFGGHIYQDLNWVYMSPTAGLFFYAEDFIRICENISIIQNKIIFINQSKHINGSVKYPIGQFKGTNIEIHFLHYHNNEEALSKWNRRVSRFNFKNYIIIGFWQNECNEEILKNFINLSFSNIFKNIFLFSYG